MKSKEEYFSLRVVCLVASSNVSHANQSELRINALWFSGKKSVELPFS